MSQYRNKVAICISTYNRLDGLEKLLFSLTKLTFEKCETPDWFVVVVDNNSNISPQNLIKKIERFLPDPIRFDIENVKGVSSSRNRAVTMALDCDLIAFIDDDEIATPLWLDELLFMQTQTNADIVRGPVLPIIDTASPKWIKRGKFFNRRRYSDGSFVKHASTNNVLIKIDWFTNNKEPFDVRLNLTGGEDTLFSKKAIKNGATCIWADKALVYEYISLDRTKVFYLLRRAFRNGWTLTIVDKAISNSFFNLFSRFIKGFLLIIFGLIMMIPKSIFSGYSGMIKSLCSISRGFGVISGFFGLNYLEYK